MANFRLDMRPVEIVKAERHNDALITPPALSQASPQTCTRERFNIPARFVTEPLLGQFQTIQEQVLWKRFCSLETEYRLDLRQRLWELYSDEVDKRAYNYYRYKMPRYSLAEHDDIVQAARLGAIEAINSYRIEHERSFMCFASSRIYGAIIDMLRKLQDFPRIIAKWRRELRPIILQLQCELYHEPTVDEICARVGEHIRPILLDPLFSANVFNQAKTSNNHKDDGGAGEGFVNGCDYSMASVTDRSQEQSEQSEIFHRVDIQDKILAVLPKTHTFVILAYYFFVPGWTNTKIAKHLNCSNSTAVIRHKEALRMLKQEFSHEEFMEMIH